MKSNSLDHSMESFHISPFETRSQVLETHLGASENVSGCFSSHSHLKVHVTKIPWIILVHSSSNESRVRLLATPPLAHEDLPPPQKCLMQIVQFLALMLDVVEDDN